MDVYFQRNIIFLIFIRFSVSLKNYDDECNFAPSYNLDQLFASSELQHEFLMKATWWDGKFMRHGLGINAKSGLAHDGVFLNYDTGQPVMDTLFKFTNNEHEGLHLAILALTLDNNTYAVNFIRSSIEQTGGWNESVEAYVVDQLTRKISSYEHFNRTYPGFGGFFPFCDVQDDEMEPGPMVLPLLNYDTVWGLVAVSQVLRERSESNNALMKLADRYQQYIDYLASTGLNLFFQPDKGGGIAGDVLIFNAMAAPGIHNNNSAPLNMIDDPWQLEPRVMFFYLYADFSRFGGNKTRDLIWMNKRRKLVAVNFSSSDGNITVERGNIYAAIEKVKYSMLPYFDVSINERIFLNGERARTHFSSMHGIAGLFSHVSTYAAPKSYRTDDINSLYRYYGIDELSASPVNVFAPDKSVTPYAAFTLLLHPLTRSHGVVWYAAMLQGSRMQGPIGSTDGVKVTGTVASFHAIPTQLMMPVSVL